jgi:hypothetical protein
VKIAGGPGVGVQEGGERREMSVEGDLGVGMRGDERGEEKLEEDLVEDREEGEMR